MSVFVKDTTWKTLSERIQVGSDACQEIWIGTTTGCVKVYPVGSLGCWWYLIPATAKTAGEFHLCASQAHIPAEYTTYSGEVGTWSTTSSRPYNSQASQMSYVYVDEACKPKDLFALFSGFTIATKWENLDLIDTSLCTSFQETFYNCLRLTDLSAIAGWNTDNVTQMSSMFDFCKKLTALDITSWNTSKVQSMKRMFYYCLSLATLDMSRLRGDNITSAENMFGNCYALTSIDLANFNTPKLVNTNSMFCNCTKLTYLNIQKIDTSHVTNMALMFNSCEALTSLDVSAMDTSSAEDMYSMFEDCEALTSIDLTSFNTSNVTDMWWMFYGCDNITSIDLSSFDTHNVTDTHWMFRECPKLEHIYAGSGWNMDNVTDSKNMFYHDTLLPNFDSNKTDKTMAYIGGYLESK